MNVTDNFNSTLSNDLTFTHILTNPFFYVGIIIFIFLLLCVISIIIFIKNKSKLLLAKPA